MKELARILETHGRKYPYMEPRDGVKLLYQNEFGGGHLISDPESCLYYLRREYAATPQMPELPMEEDIGNGMVRIYLGALEAHGRTAEWLGQVFLRSAAKVQGSMESFQEKLRLLEALTAAGKMPFSPEALAEYLREYRAAGCPMVSHSEVYRAHYRPAYRVVRRVILDAE